MTKNILLAGLLATVVLSCVTVLSFQNQPGRREELHWIYPLNPDGRISLENINGDIHVKIWDRSELQLDVVKTATTDEQLSQAVIDVNASRQAVSISTRYDRGGNHPAVRIDYTLTVPRGVHLQNIELVNGTLDIEAVQGNVRASTINGQLTTRSLTGDVRLSTVNGALSSVFGKLSEAQIITVTSVNGPIDLTIPSDSQAQITANSISSNIKNDFGMNAQPGEHVGRSLASNLGQGTARIEINSVSGAISVNRAQDGRVLSAVSNLLPRVNEEGLGQQIKDIERASADALREADRAMREVERTMSKGTRDIQLDIGRTISNAVQQRIQSEIQKSIEMSLANIEPGRTRGNDVYSSAIVERESKSFPANANSIPRVVIETFDGSIVVRSWDRPEVSYTAQKRAQTSQEMAKFAIQAEARGSGEIVIAAKPVQPGQSVRGSVHFEVNVPRRTHLRVSTGDGRVSLEGVSGELEALTGDGAIYVKEGEGSLRAVTGDGRISLEKFDGAVEARTGDGRISLSGRFSSLDARTGDGTISLALSSVTDAVIETTSESVSVDGAYTPEDTDESKKTRRWRLGNGSETIFTLRTGDGRILLEQTVAP